MLGETLSIDAESLQRRGGQFGQVCEGMVEEERMPRDLVQQIEQEYPSSHHDF